MGNQEALKEDIRADLGCSFFSFEKLTSAEPGKLVAVSSD